MRELLDEIDCQPVIPWSGSWQTSRFATRYEKTLRSYAAVVTIGCALLWLRI